MDSRWDIAKVHALWWKGAACLQRTERPVGWKIASKKEKERQIFVGRWAGYWITGCVADF